MAQELSDEVFSEFFGVGWTEDQNRPSEDPDDHQVQNHPGGCCLLEQVVWAEKSDSWRRLLMRGGVTHRCMRSSFVLQPRWRIRERYLVELRPAQGRLASSALETLRDLRSASFFSNEISVETLARTNQNYLE